MRVAVLWSGGKESSLACYRVMTEGHHVAFLVTFTLNDWPSLCHLLSMISLQSEALGIDVCGENGEYHTIVLDGPVFKRCIRIEEFTVERKNSVPLLRPRRISLQPKGA